MENREEMLIESLLPADFLHKLGLYHQTVAYTEAKACSVIWMVEAVAEGRDLQTKRFHELRKLKLDELISALKKISDYLVEDHANALTEFVDWINEHKMNRHMAAHGVFSFLSGSNEFSVNYIKKEKDHGEWKYTEENITVSREVLSQSLLDADRIFRALAGLERAVSEGRVPIRHPS